MRNRPIERGLSVLLVLSIPALAYSAPTHSGARAGRARTAAHFQPYSDAREVALAHPFRGMIPISGRVTLPGGAPAARARVFLSWVTNSSQTRFHAIQADEHGAFAQSFRMGDGPFFNVVGVTALLPGKGIAWRTIIKPGQLTGLKLQLEHGVTLTGRMIRADGSPVANTKLGVKSIFPSGAVGRPQESPFISLAHILDDQVAAATFQTVTDGSGRFALTGLPYNSGVFLSPGNGFQLTQGSLSPVALHVSARQDAGILVASKPGGLKVCVSDNTTGKPVANALVTVTSKDARPARFMFMGQRLNQLAMERLERRLNPDAKGEVVVKDLMPGAYEVAVEGRVVEAEVREDHMGDPLRFALRQGALKGRLLDENGKAVANTSIMMRSDVSNSGPFGISPFMQTAWENQPVTTTDANGNFEIAQFPWGSHEVTLRATRGDDRAEWRGDPARIGATLKLYLTPDALITVTGRLIDPQRRAITGAQGQALHWTELPRATWFGNAHAVQADGQGRFKLAGLERSESFSIVTGGPMIGLANQQAVAINSVKTAHRDFESPRFVTGSAGTQQDLGDVMVHPLENGQQTFQIYGGESAEDSIANVNLLPSPTAEAVAAAKDALIRYTRALQAGDLDTVYALTSRAAAGWSDQRSRFLRDATLRTRLAGEVDPASLHIVRLVPRFAASLVINFNTNPISMFGMGGNSASRELALHPDWVFLTTRQDSREILAGILRREEGEWRVVSGPGDGPTGGMEGMILGQIAVPAVAKNAAQGSHPLTEMDRCTAQKVGEQYLRSWAQERPETMLALTADQSPDHAPQLAAYKERFEQRLDEGFCPLNANDSLHLELANDLAEWEKLWLVNFAQMRGMTAASRRGPNVQQRRFQPPTAENLAAFRYEAGGKNLLMLLSRRNGRWQVFEPALPL